MDGNNLGKLRIMPAAFGSVNPTWEEISVQSCGNLLCNSANIDLVGEHDWLIASRSALEGKTPITNVRIFN